MRNVEMSLKDSVLTITVDLKKSYGQSKSGKSITIASTDGNVSVEGQPDVKVGLNIYRSRI